VQVGIDHDTAQFAVNSIRGWWEHLGRERYPDARPAFGHRRLRWRQRLSHAPVEGRGAAPGRRDRAGEPGLSRPAGHRAAWNKIEHRLFSFITSNGRGKPLTELATIINLIASTTTRSGLKVFARLDEGSDPAKVTVSDAELEAVNLHGHAFHPDWNDTREPRVITRRRLTLHAEGAASARAWGAVATGCFARLLSREVDCTPRSEVLDEPSSATAS
jgi:Rhodopirellula transposase DDE domain